MTRGNERHSREFDVMLSRLFDCEPERAHVVTAFFLSGFGAGHRLRRHFDSLPPGEFKTSRALVESVHRFRDDPFVQGWGYGWRFQATRTAESPVDPRFARLADDDPEGKHKQEG